MNQYHIHVRGLVQGRIPSYVYHLANEMGLRGYVDNSVTEFLSCCNLPVFKGEILEGFDKIGSVTSIEHIETITMPCLEKYESFECIQP